MASNKGELNFKPAVPKYRKSGGLYTVSFPKKWLKLTDAGLRFPLGKRVKAWFGIDSFYLPMPSNLKFSDIKEVRVLPRNKCFYAEFIYPVEQTSSILDKEQALGIDHGVNNWLTCVDTRGNSFIIDGKHLKSVNQWYNKQVSIIKEGRTQGFWSKKLSVITEKRNRQMRDAINKVARLVINHCLRQGIGTIVFGWNQGNKQEINLGRKNNQRIVQVPTARLKERISQLCEQYGIRFSETEEANTSLASFLDGDSLPRHGEPARCGGSGGEIDSSLQLPWGSPRCSDWRTRKGEKPIGWKSSGKRVKRGLFRTAQNQYVNADANGSANILRKVATTLGICLKEVGRGALITPLRIRFWIS